MRLLALYYEDQQKNNDKSYKSVYQLSLLIYLFMSLVAYCFVCYHEQHYQKLFSGSDKCQACGQVNGMILYPNKPVATAYCSKCFKEHKTHRPPNTSRTCTGCGYPFGLQFSTEQPFVYPCQYCHTVYKSHKHSSTSMKCLNCGKNNGLQKK